MTSTEVFLIILHGGARQATMARLRPDAAL
jgi:hypothetical protein